MPSLRHYFGFVGHLAAVAEVSRTHIPPPTLFFAFQTLEWRLAGDLSTFVVRCIPSQFPAFACRIPLAHRVANPLRPLLKFFSLSICV
jgi:hypothetical protein